MLNKGSSKYVEKPLKVWIILQSDSVDPSLTPELQTEAHRYIYIYILYNIYL